MAIGPLLGGIGGLIGGGASLLSGLFGGGGSSMSGLEDAINTASQRQYMADQQAIQAQQQALQEARGYEQPFYTAGRQGLGQYMNMLGLGPQGTGYDATAWLQKTPGYQWTLGQGVNALDRSAAASGLLKSGAQYKGLMNYGEGLATNMAYAPYMSALADLTNKGWGAASLMGGQGIQTAGNVGNILMNQGQSQANAAEQIGLANLLGQQQNWNRMMGGMGAINTTLSNPQFTNALGGLWNRFGSNAGSAMNNAPYSTYTGLDY